MTSSANQVAVNPEHLEGGDGTIRMAMTLWSSRNGPCIYNQWQSLYFQLRKRPEMSDHEVRGIETQQELQVRLRKMFREISEELHGPDYLAQAILNRSGVKTRLELPRQVTVPQGEETDDQQIGVTASEPHLHRGSGCDTPDDLKEGRLEKYSIATPRRSPDPTEETSPLREGAIEKLLHVPEAVQIIEEGDATHTEATDEMDERCTILAQKLAALETADHSNLQFVVLVEQLVKDYRDLYGDWFRRIQSGLRSRLKCSLWKSWPNSKEMSSGIKKI